MRTVWTSQRLFSGLYIWFYSILSSTVIYPGLKKKKSLYVSELRKFVPLSREPFKDVHVTRAAGGLSYWEKELVLQAPPSLRRPSSWLAPYLPVLAFPANPSRPHLGNFGGLRGLGRVKDRTGRLTCGASPPAPLPQPLLRHRQWPGNRTEQGEGKSYTHPPSSSPPRVQIHLHLLLF